MYSKAVSLLLDYGDPDLMSYHDVWIWPPYIREMECHVNCHMAWPDYVKECGLNVSHVPDIIYLVKKSYQHKNDSLKNRFDWACIHGWRALGQLEANEAVSAIVEMLEIDRPYQDSDDWAFNEIPVVLNLMDATVISFLLKKIQQTHEGTNVTEVILKSLWFLTHKYQSFQKKYMQTLHNKLLEYKTNDFLFNSDLIYYLVESKNTKSIPLIRKIMNNNYAYDRCDNLEDFLKTKTNRFKLFFK